MNVSPFDIAYSSLLKAPIVDTDIPGVRMGYSDKWTSPNNYTEPTIGEWPFKYGEADEITDMTPNEYFDIIQALAQKEGGVDRGMFQVPPIQGKDAEYRWDGMKFSPWGGSREAIAAIQAGMESGKPIGMPELEFRGGEFNGVQDGGHRMEALRQMGHGDTSVPVMRHNMPVIKSDDERKKIEDYFKEKDWGEGIDETASGYYFTMGWPLTPFNRMNDRQIKLFSQMIFNHGTDGQPNDPSYWREPFQEAGHDYSSQILMGDGMEHIPDKAYEEIIRYHQHFNDAVNELPGGANPEFQSPEFYIHSNLMGMQPEGEPSATTHPHTAADQRMENEYEEWGEHEQDFGNRYGIFHENRQFTPQMDDESWRDNIETGTPMDIAMRLLKEEVDVSGQHAPRNDPKFWEVMRHYGTQDPNAVDVPFYPYNKELGEMTPQVDELIAGYGYTPYYFGGRYPMPDLGKKNYDTGHLAVFDPGEEAASFGGNEQFTANWRKLHELGHAQGLEDLNAEWGEGRRLGKLGARSPREMLRAVDWETRALTNQRKLMEEVGLPVGQTEYNRDWNTTIGDAGFRAVTGQFTSPEGEGFVPHDEKISQDHAMNAVRTRAEELGLDMDETSADKRRRDKTGGARKVASEPMDIAYQLLKWEEHSDMHGPEKNFNQYFGIKDSWVTLPKEGMDSRPELYGEVASAMNTAYAGVGGHDKYKNGDDLQDEDKHARYDMIDNDQDPYVDAARVFSQQDQGFKVSLTAHDGRKDARVAVKEHMFDHMKTPGHYAELSGGWNRLMEEQDIAPIEDYEHIQDLVNRPTRPTETGPGTYTRDIGGTEREKQIYGQPMKEGAEWTNDFMQQSVASSRAGQAMRLDSYDYPKNEEQGDTQ